MATFNIGITNASSLSASDLSLLSAAINIQLSRDFDPLWGISGQINLPGKAYYDINVGITDQPSPSPGVLGYHVLGNRGCPEATVFYQECLKDNVPVSSVISHEICESLANRGANTCKASLVGQYPALIIAYEVCDPVEPTGYMINGIEVANFVTPRWFNGLPIGDINRNGDESQWPASPALTLIIDTYQRYLGRFPSNGEVQTWLGEFSGGTQPPDIIGCAKASPEYRDLIAQGLISVGGHYLCYDYLGLLKGPNMTCLASGGIAVANGFSIPWNFVQGSQTS